MKAYFCDFPILRFRKKTGDKRVGRHVFGWLCVCSRHVYSLLMIRSGIIFEKTVNEGFVNGFRIMNTPQINMYKCANSVCVRFITIPHEMGTLVGSREEV